MEASRFVIALLVPTLIDSFAYLNNRVCMYTVAYFWRQSRGIEISSLFNCTSLDEAPHLPSAARHFIALFGLSPEMLLIH